MKTLKVKLYLNVNKDEVSKHATVESDNGLENVCEDASNKPATGEPDDGLVKESN